MSVARHAVRPERVLTVTTMTLEPITITSDASPPGLSYSDASPPGLSYSDASPPGLSYSDASPPGLSYSDASPPGLSYSDASPPGLSYSDASPPGLSYSDASPPGLSYSDASPPGLSCHSKLSPTYSDATCHSPGACSNASSEDRVYIRQPGFGHRAQIVRAEKKGKKLGREEEKRTRGWRKEPLPMKYRSLPQSFWQEPNITTCLSPGTCYPVLPALGTLEKEEEVSGRFSMPSNATAAEELQQQRTTTKANTDLLFSLFRRVEVDLGRAEGRFTTVKKGRPKKPASYLLRVLRDDDPYLNSGVTTDSMLPLIPARRAQQMLAMVALKNGDKSVTLPSLDVQHNYSQMLTELVIKL